MSSTRDTNRPPKRPSTRRFVRAGVDSKKVDEAQSRILEGLRTMILNLVGRAFDESQKIVREALLHSGLDLYNEGKANGTKETMMLCNAYLAILDRKYALMVHDPRVEVVRPSVTAQELCDEILLAGQDASIQEVQKKCTETGVPLAAEEE